ncbi:hypothetical protein [Profundibacter amoris]|uniref:hypothetical protein n=1 Tax=Profundibacter amoris TaxID=2171755 RepID=UPI0013C2FD6C|nr:hypothetical protein [Profundibacter amoris]
MNGNCWKLGRGKRILLSIVVTALINAVCIWPINANAGEVIAKAHSFEVPVSSLNTEASPIYYHGLPLNADHPSMGYSDGQEAMATAEKFPDVLNCLLFKPEDETVSLVRLNPKRIETIVDFEICLQRVGNELGELSKVEPWLHAIGFSRAGERPTNFWLSANRLGVNAEDVVVFYAQWRNGDSFIGRSYPLNFWNNWSTNFLAKNMDLTLVVRRRDLRVISVNAVMIYL